MSNSRYKDTQRGLIQTIVIVIIGIILLSYFGIDLQTVVHSALVKKNFLYTIDLIQTGWREYLATPFEYGWKLFVTLLEKTKN